jgi:DNA polymerase-3 subunit delta
MNSPGAYIYLLYGEDTFSRDEAVRTLKERMRALPAGEHNLTELDGAETSVAGLRAAADAVPFLADRRMVIVRGLIGRLQAGGGVRRRGRSKSADAQAPDEYQALLAYLPVVPDTTSLVFVEDQAIQPDPLVGAIPRGRALVREFPRVRDVADWIRRRAVGIGVEIDESAVRELAMLGGEDLRRLDGELRKLAAYTNGRPASRADVQELVVGRDIVIWALLDALADRRRDQALAALRRLYRQGEAPEAILTRDVAPLYRRLLLAKEISLLSRRDRASVDLAALGLNPRTLPRLSDQAARFERDELERALDLLLELDRQIKTGETQPEAAVELLIVRLCSRLSAPGVA